MGELAQTAREMAHKAKKVNNEVSAWQYIALSEKLKDLDETETDQLP
jgi:hypothetical protein